MLSILLLTKKYILLTWEAWGNNLAHPSARNRVSISDCCHRDLQKILSGETFCLVKHFVWSNILSGQTFLSGLTFCLVKHFVWRNILSGEILCLMKHFAWQNILSGETFCQVKGKKENAISSSKPPTWSRNRSQIYKKFEPDVIFVTCSTSRAQFISNLS